MPGARSRHPASGLQPSLIHQHRQIHQAVREAPLVVVPRQDLHHVAANDQLRAAADGGNTPRMGRSRMKPVHHGGSLQLIHAATGNDDGIELFTRVQFRQTFRVQPVGLHQNVSYTGGSNSILLSETIISISSFPEKYIHYKISQQEAVV